MIVFYANRSFPGLLGIPEVNIDEFNYNPDDFEDVERITMLSSTFGEFNPISLTSDAIDDTKKEEPIFWSDEELDSRVAEMGHAIHQRIVEEKSETQRDKKEKQRQKEETYRGFSERISDLKNQHEREMAALRIHITSLHEIIQKHFETKDEDEQEKSK